MIWMLVFFVVLGAIIGLLTGLAPGIHINLVAVAIIALLPFFGLEPLFAAILILAIAITHIFLDFIRHREEK